MTSAADIVSKFNEYFKESSFLVKNASPIIIAEDKSLMFVNAGMNQFKQMFLGSHITHNKIATIQKCIRAGGKDSDIDNVGITSRHLTYFEMLGNFIFESENIIELAIKLVFDFLVKSLKLDKMSLWATVHQLDEVSYKIWSNILPKERIVKMGDKDNYWQMGAVGPCGYCTEILIDRGFKYGPANNPLEDVQGDRFLEIWNIVLMSRSKTATGESNLESIKIDTGAGLERLAMVLQNVDSVFEIDKFSKIINRIANEIEFDVNKDNEVAFRIIADHLSSSSIIISDKVYPGNNDRGYVLKKILRRAFRMSNKYFGFNKPILYKCIQIIAEETNHIIKDRIVDVNEIASIVKSEEEKFFLTMDRNEKIFNRFISKAPIDQNILSGESIFNLKDTYGISLEEIKEMSNDLDLELDEDGFISIDKKHKDANRKLFNEKSKGGIESKIDAVHSSLFSGYFDLRNRGSILSIYDSEGIEVESLVVGEEGRVVVDKAALYPEQGGQISDIGELKQGNSLAIVTKSLQVDKSIVYEITVSNGSIEKGEFEDFVNKKIRQANSRAHTATHLLHLALRKILNSDCLQSGSSVGEDRIRFDFKYNKKLSDVQISQIESIVSDYINRSIDVVVENVKYKDISQDKSIMQMFSDKYGEYVRVVSIDDSKELCCGTHVGNTEEIIDFQITSETSSSSGVRRIEAICGKLAINSSKESTKILNDIKLMLAAHGVQDVKVQVDKIKELSKSQKEEISILKSKIVKLSVKELIESNLQKFDGADLFIEKVSDKIESDIMSNQIINSFISKSKDAIVLTIIDNSKVLNINCYSTFNCEEFINKLRNFFPKGKFLGNERKKTIIIPNENYNSFYDIVKSIIDS